MTVNQLLTSLDSRELTEWRAYFRLEKELKDEAQPNSPNQLSHGLKTNLTGYGK